MKDIALEEREITNILPIDKHGNIRDVNGENVAFVWHEKGEIITETVVPVYLFAHRNNKIFKQRRFIYIFETLKHFSIQTG